MNRLTSPNLFHHEADKGAVGGKQYVDWEGYKRTCLVPLRRCHRRNLFAAALRFVGPIQL
jgi:hypothetical protein